MRRSSPTRLALAALLAGLVLALPAAAAGTFTGGDLVVTTPTEVLWLTGSGATVATLDPGFTDTFLGLAASGAGFDRSGRLWLVSLDENRAVAFDASGTSLGSIVDPIQDPYLQGPTDLAFDALGNALIGSFAADGPVSRFGPDGAPLGTVLASEADSLDLASDQCTLLYLDANAGQVRRKDICTGTPSQLVPQANPASDLSESKGLRILADGTFLVAESDGAADGSAVRRWRLDGTVAQAYDTPACARWFEVTLGTTGTTFWSSCLDEATGTFTPHEFDLATGAVLRTLPVNGVVSAVLGGFRAAQDRTAPTVSIASPLDGATVTLGSPLLADYACADTGGSGLESCTGTVPDGAALDTATLGPKTLQVQASDRAGNVASATIGYTVVPDFGGFAAPIDASPTFNVVRAGRTVPVRFSLGGDRGLAIFAPGSPSSTWTPCDATAPQDTVEQTTSARGGSLTFNTRTGLYTYAFRTYRSQAGTCRLLTLRFADGGEQTVRFRLT